MLTVIVFILILGVLIFVHELGHFLTARQSGIKTDEFGFGFPPRILGFVKDEETGKRKLVWGNKEVLSKFTIYSINWIPLGGFVKIKGEDGEGKKEKDSFAGKPARTRIKVLAAGVMMNFILAWVLIAIALMIGAPEAVDSAQAVPNAHIQVTDVASNSPASTMGLKIGDEIVGTPSGTKFQSVSDLQKYIDSHKGQQIILEIKRGNQTLDLKGVPRANPPAGQGALGVELAATIIKSYPWYEAIWQGLLDVFNLIWAMIVAIYGILKSLFMGHSVSADVTGPVGIAILTKQVTALGLVYVLQFAALLSINLGIINAIPFPALDGGRILFVVIEKIKGRPVSQRVEQTFHTVGFLLLILLMIIITFRDVSNYIK